MQHLGNDGTAHDEAYPSPRPRKPHRKQRPCYSCAGELKEVRTETGVVSRANFNYAQNVGG